MASVASFAARYDFSKTESQSLAVHSVRFVFLLLVLVITLSFQFLESRVDATQVFYPVYELIVLSFVLQFLFLVFFKSLYQNSIVSSFLFFFEAFYITGLIYYIGVQQSILIFLYLVNLILYGILYQRKGALILALWTSTLFSFIVSLDTNLNGHVAYLAVGVNNLAFFTVAYLSGYLSEQLNFMGEQLKERVRDVVTLKNLNDLILRNISSGLITVDNKGRLLQTNPSAYQLLGIPQTDLKGNSLSDIMPGFELANHKANKNFDYIYKRLGEKRIFNMTISPLFDERNVEQGKIVSFQDETQLRTMAKRLRQSEKMAAIGQLAAGIAHEIRNPLAGISGSIQLLQTNDTDPSQTAKLMGIVMKEIDRLNNLITEFLDFAKPEAPMEDQITMGNLLEDVLNMAKADPRFAKIKTAFECSEELRIMGNRDKLKQAFLNIIVNGFQALDNCAEPMLAVSVNKNGSKLVVSIKDNGIGMDENLRERIFEPFHTTKQKGTGLGLAITHSILESHGADIQVESELRKGSEFKIRFQLLN